MFRKTVIGAVAALSVGLMAMGCSDDDSDFIPPSVSPIFLVGAYPGSPVSTNWVADDGRALSHNGVSVDIATVGEAWWPNAGRDTGLLFYVTGPSGAMRLMATYWNGGSFTPPVEIRGENQDSVNSDVGNVAVLWLNPAGADGFRSGDAIILFARQELDPINTTLAEGNVRLYSSYLDASATGVDTNGTWRFGIQTVATFVDNDTRIGGADVDVGNFGFVSDGCSYSYGLDGGTGQWEGESGADTTTRVWALYRRATATETRWYYNAFDLSSTNTTNSFTTTGDTGLSTSATTGESDGTGFVAHNCSLFWLSANTNDTAVLNHNQMDVSIATTAVISHNSTGAGDGNVTATIAADNVYGPDHGLARTHVIFTEGGWGEAADTGDPLPDVDVVHSLVDQTLAAATIAPTEIDAFSGNTDTVGATLSPASAFSTRINSNGGLIFVAWIQVATNSTTATNVRTIPWMNAIETTEATALAVNIRTQALSHGTARALSTITGTASNTNVTTFKWQMDLADGTESYHCNVQSNSGTMNLLWDQSADPTVAFRMQTNGLSVAEEAALPPAAGPTTALLNASSVEVDSIVPEWFDGLIDFNGSAGGGANDTWGTAQSSIFDRGDSAGNPAVVYIHQHGATFAGPDNDPDVATVAYNDPRVYFWAGGTATQANLISSPGFAGTIQARGVSGLASVVQTDSQVVVLFHENDNVSGRTTLQSRVWSKTLANQTVPAAFIDQFLPVLATGGTASERVDSDLSLNAGLSSLRRGAGNSAEVYFLQGGDIWWNAWSGVSWRQAGGGTDPQVVSHGTAADVINGPFLLERGGTGASCADTSVIVLWTENDLDDVTGQQDLRLQARAR